MKNAHWLGCIILITHLSCGEQAEESATGVPEFRHAVVRDEPRLQRIFTNVADMDRDGYTDILGFGGESDTTNFLSWYQYPRYKQYVVRHGNFNVGRPLAADIDGDGDQDIIVAKSEDRTIYWYENPVSDGSIEDEWMEHRVGLTKDTDKGDYIKDYAVADFYGDGRQDIVVCTFDDPAEVFIYFQNSADDWHKATHLFENGHEGLDLGDLDGDGDEDIVLNGRWFETPTDPRSNPLIEHEIDPKWHNQSGTWQRNATMTRVADIDGDGKPDVVLSHSEMEDYPLSWYSAEDPKGQWVEHQIDASYGWCQTLDVGDVDSDGDLDVLAGRFTRPSAPMVPPPNDVRIYYNPGDVTGTWQVQSLSLDESIYFGHLADMDRDGDLDVVGPRSYWTGPINLWTNQLLTP